MIYKMIKDFSIVAFLSTNICADLVPIYDNWLNNSFASSKNSIVVGATTATAKGYSALLTNPAGMSTHSNITLYANAFRVSKEDATENEILNLNNVSIGLLYDFVGIELRIDDYVVLGAGYGLETDYGLFSLGVSHLFDLADMTIISNDIASNKEFTTGDYTTAGLMWQKSFIGQERFYSLYFGYSHKTYGIYNTGIASATKLIYTSPKKESIGIGMETNIRHTTVMFTIDSFKETGQNITLKGMSYGFKWLIAEKFAIGMGMSNQTFSAGELEGIELLGAGFEIGFQGIQMNVSATNRVIQAKAEQNNLTENAIHLDLAFVY